MRNNILEKDEIDQSIIYSNKRNNFIMKNTHTGELYLIQNMILILRLPMIYLDAHIINVVIEYL